MNPKNNEYIYQTKPKKNQLNVHILIEIILQKKKKLPWTESEEDRDLLKRFENALVWDGSDKGGNDIGAALSILSPCLLVSKG